MLAGDEGMPVGDVGVLVPDERAKEIVGTDPPPPDSCALDGRSRASCSLCTDEIRSAETPERESNINRHNMYLGCIPKKHDSSKGRILATVWRA